VLIKGGAALETHACEADGHEDVRSIALAQVVGDLRVCRLAFGTLTVLALEWDNPGARA